MLSSARLNGNPRLSNAWSATLSLYVDNLGIRTAAPAAARAKPAAYAADRAPWPASITCYFFQLSKGYPRSNLMRTDIAQSIRLKDYRPPGWLVETVSLDVSLHPTATRVRATLHLSRAQGPLQLHLFWTAMNFRWFRSSSTERRCPLTAILSPPTGSRFHSLQMFPSRSKLKPS